MPHGGYDEEDYIAAVELVKIIMAEGRKMGAKDFFIGGDLNIELKLEGGSEEWGNFTRDVHHAPSGPQGQDMVPEQRQAEGSLPCNGESRRKRNEAGAG